VQVNTCSRHVRVTSCIKIDLCCVRLNKCGLVTKTVGWLQTTYDFTVTSNMLYFGM